MKLNKLLNEVKITNKKEVFKAILELEANRLTYILLRYISDGDYKTQNVEEYLLNQWGNIEDIESEERKIINIFASLFTTEDIYFVKHQDSYAIPIPNGFKYMFILRYEDDENDLFLHNIEL